MCPLGAPGLPAGVACIIRRRDKWTHRTMLACFRPGTVVDGGAIRTRQNGGEGHGATARGSGSLLAAPLSTGRRHPTRPGRGRRRQQPDGVERFSRACVQERAAGGALNHGHGSSLSRPYPDLRVAVWRCLPARAVRGWPRRARGTPGGRCGGGRQAGNGRGAAASLSQISPAGRKSPSNLSQENAAIGSGGVLMRPSEPLPPCPGYALPRCLGWGGPTGAEKM